MKLNKRIIKAMSIVCSLFLIVIIYLTYFTFFEAKDIVNSSYNQRIWEKEEKVLRGKIYDRKGFVLAESKKTESGQKRVYPYKGLYTHSVGYNSRVFGKTNIELNFNDYLLKTESILNALKNNDSKEKDFSVGANLNLTLDHEMTKLASSLMKNSNGSVIALNPITGETYCLYSNPTFDPNEDYLIENWDELTQSEFSPFLSRATQGLYAPGSTFKIVTSASAIENGFSDYELEDEGKIKINGKEIRNSGEKAHGLIGMEDGFRLSSNVYFSTLAKKLGKKNLNNSMEDFYLNRKIPYDISTKAVEFNFDNLDDLSVALTGIGQGQLQVTPLHMALTACAVANDGIIMRPYIVQSASYDDGRKIYNFEPQILASAIKPSTASILKEYMVQVTKSGTGTSARVSGIEVAGKTGTAENEKKNKTHAWFVGFAPADNPQIVVCVMKEYSGRSGGAVCAPIASKIIKHALNNGLIN